MMRKYVFLLPAGLLMALIVLAIPRKRDFRRNGEEVLARIKLGTQIISVHKLKAMKAEVPGLQLVDLRGEDAYLDGHLPDALSLPAGHLSAGEIYRFFREKESPYVLYAADTYLAEMYWILFTQMGVDRLYVLETGRGLDSMIMNWDAESGRKIMVDEIPQFSFQPDTAYAF